LEIRWFLVYSSSSSPILASLCLCRVPQGEMDPLIPLRL
jgi:hypothetical protein